MVVIESVKLLNAQMINKPVIFAVLSVFNPLSQQTIRLLPDGEAKGAGGGGEGG